MDEYNDGLVLIAGVLYDADTLEEVSDEDCRHTATLLTEEGYECLDCGRVLGHTWRRNSNVGDEGESRPIPHYPGDEAHVKWCKACQQYKAERQPGQSFPEWLEHQRRLDAQHADWVNGEVPSWDVYTVQA